MNADGATMPTQAESAVWRLVLISGEADQSSWLLETGSSVRIGRQDCEVLIKGDKVSRECCKLESRCDAVLLKEGSPRRATRVNGVPLPHREVRELKAGDVLAFGGQHDAQLRLERVADVGTDTGSGSPEATPTEYLPEGWERLDAMRRVDVDTQPGQPLLSNATAPSISDLDTNPMPTCPTGGETNLPTQESLIASPIIDAPPTEAWPPPGIEDEAPEGQAVASRRLFIYGGLGVLVLLVVLFNRGPRVPPPQTVIEKPGLLRIALPGRYETQQDQTGGYRLVGTSGKPTLVVTVHESSHQETPSPYRWLTYEAVVTRIKAGGWPLPAEVEGIEWQEPREADGRLACGIVELGCPDRYCDLFSAPNWEVTGGQTMRTRLRLWLHGEKVITAVSWIKAPNGNTDCKLTSQLNGVRLVSVPEFAFNRHADGDQDLSGVSTLSLLDEARRLLNDRSAEMANAWLAHIRAREVWRRVTLDPRQFDANEQNRIWSLVTETSAVVQRNFLEKQRAVTVANKLRRQVEMSAACEYIQLQIPDRRDSRWQWARMQLNNAKKKR